jgi:methionyl aminopeptidase
MQKSHKIVHDLVKGQGMPPARAADGTYNPFPTFDYRGTVRPRYPLSPKRDVPAHIGRPEYADDPEGAYATLCQCRCIWKADSGYLQF